MRGALGVYGRPIVRVRLASCHQDYASFGALSRAYVKWLQEDLSFQGFEHEMKSLPGIYRPPDGCILLASLERPMAGPTTQQDVGCVGLRRIDIDGSPFNGSCCEMKRLFVLQEHSGAGVGDVLVQQALQEAAAKGYDMVVLETLQRLKAANNLYQKLGFERTEAYYHNPLPKVVFYSKKLQG